MTRRKPRRVRATRSYAAKPPALTAAPCATFKRKAAEDESEIATRKASEAVIGALAPAVPELILGSADLTGSTNNKVAATPDVTPADGYKPDASSIGASANMGWPRP